MKAKGKIIQLLKSVEREQEMEDVDKRYCWLNVGFLMVMGVVAIP